MRAPLLRPLVGGVDAGSFLTVVLDVDADPDEQDAIRRGIHELPCRRDREGGIPRMGELPRSMCASTSSRVRPGTLHQRRLPAALLRAEEGEVRRRR
jgi:hypothetical protein